LVVLSDPFAKKVECYEFPIYTALSGSENVKRHCREGYMQTPVEIRFLRVAYHGGMKVHANQNLIV
jgi:hypothetical protein